MLESRATLARNLEFNLWVSYFFTFATRLP